MKYSFLNKIKDTVYFIGNLMEIYIPTEFFKIGMASYKGDKIETFGIFQFVVYTDENERDKHSGDVHTLKLPMYINFQYEESFKAKDVLGKNKDDYTVFTLRKGNIFLDTVDKEQSSATVKDFIFKLHAGKIPNSTLYTDVFKIYLDSIKLNSVNLENNAVIFETEIAELYRSKHDDTIPFRKAINKNPNISLTDYHAIGIKDLPNIKGTFQALMFENIRQSVLYSVLRTKTGVKDVETPLEDVAKL